MEVRQKDFFKHHQLSDWQMTFTASMWAFCFLSHFLLCALPEALYPPFIYLRLVWSNFALDSVMLTPDRLISPAVELMWTLFQAIPWCFTSGWGPVPPLALPLTFTYEEVWSWGPILCDFSGCSSIMLLWAVFSPGLLPTRLGAPCPTGKIGSMTGAQCSSCFLPSHWLGPWGLRWVQFNILLWAKGCRV